MSQEQSTQVNPPDAFLPDHNPAGGHGQDWGKWQPEPKVKKGRAVFKSADLTIYWRRLHNAYLIPDPENWA